MSRVDLVGFTGLEPERLDWVRLGATGGGELRAELPIVITQWPGAFAGGRFMSKIDLR